MGERADLWVTRKEFTQGTTASSSPQSNCRSRAVWAKHWPSSLNSWLPWDKLSSSVPSRTSYYKKGIRHKELPVQPRGWWTDLRNSVKQRLYAPKPEVWSHLSTSSFMNVESHPTTNQSTGLAVWFHSTSGIDSDFAHLTMWSNLIHHWP